METPESNAAQSPANHAIDQTATPNANAGDYVTATAAPPEWLNLTDMAREMRIAKETVTELNLNGLIPAACRVCRRLLWNRREFVAWGLFGAPPRNRWEKIWEIERRHQLRQNA